jgi:hypothetical protein
MPLKCPDEQAYAAIPHRRTVFRFERSAIDGPERAYLRLVFEIIDLAVVARVSAYQSFYYDGKDRDELLEGMSVLANFVESRITPPDGLESYLRSTSTQPSRWPSWRKRRVVEEYMVRGGFLLLVEDNYPYFEWQYRAKTEGTLFDFFARELPQRNPEFSTGRAGPGHPLFTQHYRIEIPPLIQQEMDENSDYRGETLFLHEGRLAGYTLSLFAFHDGDEHVPLRPPYRPYDLILSGHELLVNIYLYTSQH